MDSVQETTNQIMEDQKASNQFYIPLEDLALNLCLSHLLNKTFSHLNPKELAICRLISKSLKDHVDNNKQWWICQLDHMRTKPTTFIDYEAKEKPTVKGLIETKFPEWKVAAEHFIKETSRVKLQKFVIYMWKYFNDHEKQFCNPLHHATYHGDIGFVQLLLDSPFDFNIQTNSTKGGVSVLALACSQNHIQILELLIKNNEKKNINFDIKDNDGNAPFHRACQCASLELVKLLESHLQSENINLFQLTNNGCSIFHLSTCNPDNRVQKYIFEKLMDNFEDFGEMMHGMIFYALVHGTEEAVNYLLESRKLFNININATKFFGHTILHLTCMKKRTDVFENVVKCLKEDSSDIDANTPDNLGRTPLHIACKFGNLETLKLLLTLKPNMRALTNNGSNIICCASWNPDSNVLQHLLTTHSSMVAHATDQHGWTALHFACQDGILENVKLLFECKELKSFDAGNAHGNTPLHFASLIGNDKVVEYILSQSKIKPIDIHKVNNSGHTAEDEAKLEGHTKVLEVFEMFRSKK